MKRVGLCTIVGVLALFISFTPLILDIYFDWIGDEHIALLQGLTVITFFILFVTGLSRVGEALNNKIKQEWVESGAPILVYHRTLPFYVPIIASNMKIKPSLQPRSLLNRLIDRVANKHVFWVSAGSPDRLGEILTGHWGASARCRTVAIQFEVEPEKIFFTSGLKSVFGGYQLQIQEPVDVNSISFYRRNHKKKPLWIRSKANKAFKADSQRLAISV